MIKRILVALTALGATLAGVIFGGGGPFWP
jgi:hypothetical protein